jgi:hypothetical protein
MGEHCFEYKYEDEFRMFDAGFGCSILDLGVSPSAFVSSCEKSDSRTRINIKIVRAVLAEKAQRSRMLRLVRLRAHLTYW